MPSYLRNKSSLVLLIYLLYTYQEHFPMQILNLATFTFNCRVKHDKHTFMLILSKI